MAHQTYAVRFVCVELFVIFFYFYYFVSAGGVLTALIPLVDIGDLCLFSFLIISLPGAPTMILCFVKNSPLLH